MKDTYGEGTYFNRVCDRCGSTSEGQHSAGAFESASGYIRIYSEEQDFKCERCMFEGREYKAATNYKTPQTLADVLKQKLDDTPQDEYTLIELTRKDVVTKTFE